MNIDLKDPVTLTQELIKCQSVTPHDGGAIDLIQKNLETLGFVCKQLKFSSDDSEEIINLYARYGKSTPNFCFAGHSDVVPIGNSESWKYNPFSGIIDNHYIYGRGASDMKGAIAAFISAADKLIYDTKGSFNGSISLLITGDEEGPAINGTKKVLSWLDDKNEILDDCLVGEPTNPSRLGEMIKIGRRGSINIFLSVFGKQGHVAYPKLAENPIPKIIKILNILNNKSIDNGNEHFQPSNLEITSIDVNNNTNNLIPEKASAIFNIRFNNDQSSIDIFNWVKKVCETVTNNFKLDFKTSGEAFLTPPGKLSNILSNVIKEELNIEPKLSTSGGTSDARFIKDFARVVEFGLISKTMHQVDEKIKVKDIINLKNIYYETLKQYFNISL